jgi:hypothetical protein
LLCKNGTRTTNNSQLCKTADQQLCVWNNEDAAIKYAEKHAYANWRVRAATSEDFGMVGSMKRNRYNRTQLCYKIMDEEKPVVTKRTTSSAALVDLFENFELRKFAISSRASSESEFIVEVAQVMSESGSNDWNTRLKETLPLIVDLCCKYRGYKAETVLERRELVAGDLEMPNRKQ